MSAWLPPNGVGGGVTFQIETAEFFARRDGNGIVAAAAAAAGMTDCGVEGRAHEETEEWRGGEGQTDVGD